MGIVVVKIETATAATEGTGRKDRVSETRPRRVVGTIRAHGTPLWPLSRDIPRKPTAQAVFLTVRRGPLTRYP